MTDEFSGVSGLVPAEKRAAPRFTLLIRTAKLITAEGEYLCVVRDASPLGLRVRTFHALPRSAAMELELATGERYPVQKIWEDGDAAGFRFAAPVDIARLLAEAPDGMRKRAVRLRLALPATLLSAREPREVVFRDISQQGACIDCGARLAMDERVRLESRYLPPITAKVRWRREPLYGLIFEQTFRFDELARVTASLQSTHLGDAQPLLSSVAAGGARR